MQRHSFLMAFAFALLCVNAWAAAPKRLVKVDVGRDAVEKVLRAEVAGPVDRRDQLAETLKTEPNSAIARWQAGFLRTGNHWIRFEDSGGALPDGESWSSYLEQRARARRTAGEQHKLADWCRTRKLPDQERSHLFAALTLGAGDATESIAGRLGYRQVAGRWLSSEQLVEWRELNRRAEQSLKKWEPQLAKLSNRLSGSPAQREASIARLKKGADNSAVPAIEYLLGGRDEEAARVAVELLRILDGFEASLALARQAVFSPWDTVRQAAGEALKGRSLDHFVPELLGLLSTPIKSEIQVCGRWDSPGVLYYNMILAQESQNQFQVAVLTTVGRVIDFDNSIEIGRISRRVHQTETALPSNSPLGLTDLDRVVSDRLRSREDAVDRQNELVAEFNRRVSGLLGTVSGQVGMTEPQDWWQWWATYSDVEYDAPKPTTLVTEDDEVALATTSLHICFTPSCFAAGTPVWTDAGLRAIESVAVGDRVLAKNVETGELEYKPVLHTTVRPPRSTVTVRVGDETISCTGGHRFWVSGEGWVKARDLKPQSLLHTVTGNAPIWSEKLGETARTYNLVVADFHTYLVGKTGILCQDLMVPKRTNSLVPGLARK